MATDTRRALPVDVRTDGVVLPMDVGVRGPRERRALPVDVRIDLDSR